MRRREEVRVHVDAGRRVHDLARDGGDVLAADLERVVGEVHGRRGHKLPEPKRSTSVERPADIDEKL